MFIRALEAHRFDFSPRRHSAADLCCDRVVSVAGRRNFGDCFRPARMSVQRALFFFSYVSSPFFRDCAGKGEDRDVATDASRTICSMRPMTSSGAREGFMQTGEPTTVRTEAASNWRFEQGGGAGRSPYRSCSQKSKPQSLKCLRRMRAGCPQTCLGRSEQPVSALDFQLAQWSEDHIVTCDCGGALPVASWRSAPRLYRTPSAFVALHSILRAIHRLASANCVSI